MTTTNFDVGAYVRELLAPLENRLGTLAKDARMQVLEALGAEIQRRIDALSQENGSEEDDDDDDAPSVSASDETPKPDDKPDEPTPTPPPPDPNNPKGYHEGAR